MPGTSTGYVTNRLLLDGISDPPVQSFPRGSNPFTVYGLLFTLYPRWDKRPTCAIIPPRLQPTMWSLSPPPLPPFDDGDGSQRR